MPATASDQIAINIPQPLASLIAMRQNGVEKLLYLGIAFREGKAEVAV